MLPASYYFTCFCIFGTKQTNKQKIDSSAEKNSAKKKNQKLLHQWYWITTMLHSNYWIFNVYLKHIILYQWYAINIIKSKEINLQNWHNIEYNNTAS